MKVIPNIQDNNEPRLVMLFSCGITSLVATKLALDENKKRWGLKTRIIYTYVKNENKDNLRFLEDCQTFLNHEILILVNNKYDGDIYKVQERGYIAGVGGAPCTTELKWRVRKEFVNDELDIQVFGFNKGEEDRLDKFAAANGDVDISVPLICQRLTKLDCIKLAESWGLTVPASYREGYHNANCIGCVKGGAGYWNKIKIDYPKIFEKQSRLEQRFNVAILARFLIWNDSNEQFIYDNLYEDYHSKGRTRGFEAFSEMFSTLRSEYYGTKNKIRLRIFLNRLDKNHGRNQKPLTGCGVMCSLEEGTQ